MAQFTPGASSAPLSEATNWTIPQITFAYTLAMLMLGCGCALGGLTLARRGPRRTCLLASALYGIGTALAGASADRLRLLYLGYGVVGGVGLGIGFVVPVAVLQSRFSDRRGLLSGIAVAGFGAGALVAAPTAAFLLMRFDVFHTLMLLGASYLVVGVAAALFLT